jgi:kynurenine formamidase
MPGFSIKDEQGKEITYTARIYPFMTHDQSKSLYKGKASFEITEMSFQTSIGTYLDSPYHRYPEKRDISQIALEEVILPGIIIDVRDRIPLQSIGVEVIPKELKLANHAVLFNFNWDRYWGKKEYYKYPFISEKLVKHLISKQVKLIGVDTINIDDSRDLRRPAHTLLLKKDILIVENLTNLDSLHGQNFRFFAVPIKGNKVAAMPIRAFAEIF